MIHQGNIVDHNVWVKHIKSMHRYLGQNLKVEAEYEGKHISFKLTPLAGNQPGWKSSYDFGPERNKDNPCPISITILNDDSSKDDKASGFSNNQLTAEWGDFCNRGNYSEKDQISSVHRSIDSNGNVKGYYSDFPLDPTLDHTDAMYPSHDHFGTPKNDKDMVVDARIINDLKSILTENEFWHVIEHLFCVGIEKGKIANPSPKRLPDNWRPTRHFKK